MHKGQDQVNIVEVYMNGNQPAENLHSLVWAFFACIQI